MCLSDNKGAVELVAAKVEKGLLKDGLYNVYNEQIQSQLDRGVAVKLILKEIAEWSGPF